VSEPSFEQSPADKLNDALVGFTGCVGEALDDLCSYGLTIGDSYVPFDPDPEDECDPEEVMCSQAWVRVMSVNPTATEESFEGGACSSELSVDLEVGVLRCLEIPEDGDAPTATQVLMAATQAMEDMNAIYCAAMSCEVWSAITAGQWTPDGPLGGQVGGIWTFTVQL
jgi:hypothetical protein